MAYATLVSLSHVTDQILSFDDGELRFLDITKGKIESFKETIHSLLAFLRRCPPIGSQRLSDIIAEMREASYEAEDILESVIATHFLQKDGSNGYRLLQNRFPEKDFERIVKRLESIDAEGRKIQPDGRYSPLDVEMERKLIDQLDQRCSKLDVIPIVGMGGIGKTTLARILYDHQLMKDTFDVRGWGTISQTYDVRQIVENILKVIGVPLDGKEDVGKYLYQTLWNRKYLIVLDDVWDIEAWDAMKRLFPENNNGSRIILTTRISEVAAYANSSSTYHEMQLLNEDSSWSLLRQEIFPQHNCPDELVEIGKEIARQCQGLPLAISAIGGHLKTKKATKENWEDVSTSVSSVLENTNDLSLEILTLSYNFLPRHLKPCFLYFGSFQQDYDIDASKMVKLWIAEGFVKPCRLKSMEEVAQEYLRDVIERNLVLVHKYDLFGKPKRCGIHDLFRDMCIRESGKEKFLCILNSGVPFDSMEINKQRCLILGPNITEADESACSRILSRVYGWSSTRSLICHGRHTSSSTIKLASRLLKVLKITIDSHKFPGEILELVNLKYLELDSVLEIPSSISRLRNLQTLIINEPVDAVQYLPSEIWEMSKLRHIVTSGFLLPDVPGKAQSTNVLKTLLTLVIMLDSSYRQEVFRRIPNLKHLNMVCAMPFHSSNSLHSLCELESLHCEFFGEPNDSILPDNVFPFQLKKLVLKGCRIPWEQLTNAISILPNLESLRLKYQATVGNLWETNDGGFMQLRILSIEESDLVEWNTEKEHFPSLERLKLKFCYALEAIPSDLVEIPTLEIIELTKCSRSAESSAKNMLGDDCEIKISIVSNDDNRPAYGSCSGTSSDNLDTSAQDLNKAMEEIII